MSKKKMKKVREVKIELRAIPMGEANRERDVIVREIFFHKHRLCMVIEMRWECKSIGTYCNGYVQTLPKNKDKSHDNFNRRVNADELTFDGTFHWMPDIHFFGFDSGHSWNDNHPESKIFGEVKERTIKLCDEMVRKGI